MVFYHSLSQKIHLMRDRMSEAGAATRLLSPHAQAARLAVAYHWDVRLALPAAP